MKFYKFRQSCGIPMNNDKLKETKKNGMKNNGYCVFCYENSNFKNHK